MKMRERRSLLAWKTSNLAFLRGLAVHLFGPSPLGWEREESQTKGLVLEHMDKQHLNFSFDSPGGQIDKFEDGAFIHKGYIKRTASCDFPNLQQIHKTDHVSLAIIKDLDYSLLEERVISSAKGIKGGNCNVTACQKPGAYWFNKSTRRYYCEACAREINWPGGRADTMELYGTPLLCEYEAPASTCAVSPKEIE